MPRYKKQTITREYSIMLTLFKLKCGWYKLKGKLPIEHHPVHLIKNYKHEIFIQVYI